MVDLPGPARTWSEKIRRCHRFCRGALPVAAGALLILVALIMGPAPRVAAAQPPGGAVAVEMPTAAAAPAPRAAPRPAGSTTPDAEVGVCEPERIYTLPDGISSQPSMSPAGDLIAFWSTGGSESGNSDGSIELFLLNTITKSLTQLTNSHGSILGGFNLAPSFNADGNLVVFYSDRDLLDGQNSDENFEIFLYDLNSGSFRQVTDTDRGVSVSPAISAGGAYIAFATDQNLTGYNPDENLEIFRIRVADGTLTQITNTGEGDTNDLPSINQNGDLIAFVSTADPTGHNPDGNLEIFLYREGQGILQITETSSDVTNDFPALSAYGTHIVYTSDKDGNTEVYLYNIVSRETRQVTITEEGNNIYPSINGSGTLVAFASNQDSVLGKTSYGTLQVFLYNPSDERMTQISDFPEGITSYPSLSAYGADTTFIVGKSIYKTNCPEANLAITKTASPQRAVAGANLTYTLLARNNGPLNGERIVITDTLPGLTDVTFLSATTPQGTCVHSGGEVACSIGTLAAGQQIPVTILVAVNPAANDGTWITNAAVIDGYVNDPFTNDNYATVSTEISTEADLAISKTDSPDPVMAGESIEYVLTVVNNGPSNSTGATVTDELPSSLTNVQTQPVGATCGAPALGTLTCDIDPLAPLGQATITITADVDPGTRNTLANRARVDGIETDPDSSNDERVATTTVNAAADLRVTKTQAAGDALAGGNWTYTMTVANVGGPSDATAVVLNDTLPPGTTAVSYSDGCSETGGTVSCALDTLAPNETKTVTLTVQIGAEVRGIITNQATVAGAETDPSPGDATVSLQTQVVGQADLSLVKTIDPSPVVAGTAVTYTLLVHNGGPSDAGGVTLTDTLPLGIAHGAAVPSQGTCEELGGMITCTLGTIGAGADATVMVPMTLAPSQRGTLTNLASVWSDEYDPVDGNNTATLITPVTGEADLWLSKTDTPDPVIAGESLAYTLVLTNNGGPSLATGVVLTDTLPPGVTYRDATTDHGTCLYDGGGGTVTCSLGDLDPGALARVIITVDVDPSTLGTIRNVALATAVETDPQSGNNTVSADTWVDAEVDLAIGKSDQPDPVRAGTALTYTLSYINRGPSDARAVCITDTLDAEVTYRGVSSQSPGWTDPPTYTAGPPATLNWCRPALPAGASGTLVFTVTVPSDVADGTQLANSVSITTTSPETAPGDNDRHVSTRVIREADLRVAKVHSGTSTTAGEDWTYTLTVTNDGPSEATSVVLTDRLPAGMTFVSVSGGFTCNESGGTVTCDLGTLAPNQSETAEMTVHVEPYVLGALDNTASVAGNEHDPALGNNSDTETTAVTTVADLAITKLDDPDPVVAGAVLTYTLQFANNGPSDAQNVTIEDTLPNPVTMGAVVSLPGGWTYTAGTPTWSALTLGAGASGTIVFTVTVADEVDQILTNTVTIASDTMDDSMGDNVDSERTDVDGDLRLTQTASPLNVVPGENVTYVIEVTNDGPSSVVNATLSDQFPAPGVFKSLSWTCTAQGGAVCANASGSGTTLQETITLPVGGKLTYTAIAELERSASGTVVNTATVTVPSWILDSTANNEATTTVNVAEQADLEATKTVDKAQPNEGEVIQYTIVVRNNGPSDAKGATLEDQLPAGVTFQSASSPPGTSYNQSTGVWTVGNLKDGHSATLTIRATVDTGTTGDTIDNVVSSLSATSPYDPDPSNNTPNVVITVNSPPVAVDDGGTGFATDEDTAFATASVLTNDHDPDTGDILTVSGFDATGTVGLVTDNGDGTFDYGPNGQFDHLAQGTEATDTFTYTIDDGHGLTDWATVTITVTGANDPPTITSTPVTTVNEDEQYSYDVAATDPDTGDLLTITAPVSATWLLLVDHGNGTATLSGRPGAADVGDHAVEIQVRDRGGLTDVQSFTITVIHVNHPPVAADDIVSTDEDTPLGIDVLANDTDPDGDATIDPTSVITMTNPLSGTVQVDPVTGVITYTPNLDINGTDTFDYQVCDYDMACDTASVTVTIVPVNDAPVAVDDRVTAVRDMLMEIGVTANDFDVDGGPLSVFAVGAPLHGVADFGSITTTVAYTAPNLFSTDVFTYMVSDGALTAVATVAVIVRPFTVTIDGPPVVPGVGEQATFTATVEVTATSPLTFSWEISGQVPPTTVHPSVSALTDTVTCTWTEGQRITVTVSNSEGSATNTWAQTGAGSTTASTTFWFGGGGRVYLPVVVRQEVDRASP